MPQSDTYRNHNGTEQPDLRQMDTLSHWLDDIIRLPGGFRIGLDGLIGLIPGAGDAAGAVASSLIIGQAASLGVSTAVLLRMIGNVLVETIIGAIPVLGDLFDFVWKANRKNMALLERHVGEASGGERGGKRLAYTIIALVLLLLLVIIALGYFFVWLIASAVGAV